MSDVTAYTMTVECMAYCYGGSSALEVDEYPDEFCVVKYADHLAALERVRVETLRELTEVVDIRIRREYGVVDGDNDFSRGLYRATQILREERNKAIRHPLRADATTTGATDA